MDGAQLKDILYIDEKFPNLKKNLKFDLSKKNGDKFIIPSIIDKSVKLVDCGGNQSPMSCMLPYIKKNWHDVNCRTKHCEI